MTDTILADRQRAAKASRLAAVLAEAGATSATIPYLSAAGWKIASLQAGVHDPSDSTKRLVATWLAEREQQPVDPFAGLDLDTAYAV